MREVFLILLCIILYGSATFFKRLGLLELNPYQFLLLTSIYYAIIIPIWLYLLKDQVNISYSGQGILYTIIYATFSVIAGLILAFLFKNTKTPGALIVMTNLSSLITLLLSYLFLQEELSFIKIIAVIFGIVSLMLMNY